MRRRMIEFVFRWYFYVVQFLSEAVAMPRMAEFCAVLHQALDGVIVSQKIGKIHICIRYATYTFSLLFL